MDSEPEALKIGLVVDDSLDRPDGVQQYVLGIGQWLTEQGHDVHYLAGETHDAGQTHHIDNAHMHSLGRTIRVAFNGNRLQMPLGIPRRQARTLLAHLDLDVLHVQMPYSPFLAGRLIKEAADRTAVVGTFHILPYSRLHSLSNHVLHAVLGSSLKRFDNVASVSRPAREFAKSHYGIDSEVIPCAIHVDDFKSVSERKPKEGTEIVYLGRLVERKGARFLLEAFSHMVQSTGKRDCLLTICGTGPLLPRLRREAQKLGISGQVQFKGFIDEADKAGYLCRADVAVFPSLGGESFGIVLLEAMASGGGVVIGGNNPGYASVLGDRPDQLVDPRNTKEFAATLAHFLDDASACQEATQWQKQAVQSYDVSVVGSKLLALYSATIAKRTARGHN